MDVMEAPSTPLKRKKPICTQPERREEKTEKIKSPNDKHCKNEIEHNPRHPNPLKDSQRLKLFWRKRWGLVCHLGDRT